jgi:hypothetical protein
MIVTCGSCGGPGKVIIDTDIDEIVGRFFSCKCPRAPAPNKE